MSNPSDIEGSAKNVPAEEHPAVPSECKVSLSEAGSTEHKQTDTPEEKVWGAPDKVNLQHSHGETQHHCSGK
jgi:hypothetical protein